MPDLTPLEAAKNLEYIDKAVLIKDIGRQYDNLRASVTVAASYLRKIASGEYAPVVHGHIAWKHRHMGRYKYKNCSECGTEIEIQRPVESDEPYCSVCGAQLAESFQDVCPRCGAILDGKDDSHEVD